jgi:hypothetical protein
MDTIAEIRVKLIKDVDDILTAFQMADKKEKSAEQVAMIEQLKAQGYLVEEAKVNQVAVDASVAAFGRFAVHSEGLKLKGAGTKTPQPVEDQTFFNNELDNETYGKTTEGAFKLMREKLAGVDGYTLDSYNPNFIVRGKVTGSVTVTVDSLGIEDANGHIIHKNSKVTFARNNPGTLADAIKLHRHMNPRGKLIAAKMAGAIVTAS